MRRRAPLDQLRAGLLVFVWEAVFVAVAVIVALAFSALVLAIV